LGSESHFAGEVHFHFKGFVEIPRGSQLIFILFLLCYNRMSIYGRSSG